jgi:hypothetical protein
MTTETQYQAEEREREAAQAAYEAAKPPVLAAARRKANKLLRAAVTTAQEHGHGVTAAPQWEVRWERPDDQGRPTVRLRQQIYCAECFRSADVVYYSDRSDLCNNGSGGRICREQCGTVTSAKAKAATECARMNAIHDLRKLLPPGTTVYTNLRHVSNNGMSRRISVHIVQERTTRNAQGNPVRESELRDITGLVARALEYRQNDRDGALVVGGCGMDMGFAVVHDLSYVLHWYRPMIETRNGTGDGSPGYTLRQRWL